MEAERSTGRSPSLLAYWRENTMPRPTEGFDPKGVSTHDNMRAEDGSKKLYCIGCGGPRDVVFAETNACGCCGSLGTQKYQPEFDEWDNLIPAEVVAACRAAAAQERAALKAAT